jgi:hypothetical protein
MTLPLGLAFVEDDHAFPVCSLCRPGRRHLLCRLYTHYEAQAIQIEASRNLRGRPRAEIVGFSIKKPKD